MSALEGLLVQVQTGENQQHISLTHSTNIYCTHMGQALTVLGVGGVAGKDRVCLLPVL